MASWRVARSLDVLLGQLNALAPKRSRAADGAIGDAAHQAQGSSSDHNPWLQLDGMPVVTARDFTHDPANGLDCNKLAEALAWSRDPRIKYMIWQGRIMDSRPQFNPWKWTPSSGHFQHLHLSVVSNWQADLETPWKLWGSQEDDDVSADDVLFNKAIVGPGGKSTGLNLNDHVYWNNQILNKLAVQVPALQTQVAGLTAALNALATGLTNKEEIVEAVEEAIAAGVVRVDVSVRAQEPSGTLPNDAS